MSQKLWIPQGPPVNQMVERSQALSEMVGHAEVVQAWLVQLILGVTPWEPVGPCSRDAALATIEAFNDIVFALESRQAQHEQSLTQAREFELESASVRSAGSILSTASKRARYGDPTDLLRVEQAQFEEEERRLAAAIRSAELRKELAAAESFEQLLTDQSLDVSAAPSEVCPCQTQRCRVRGSLGPQWTGLGLTLLL